jgi:hypothetical protein
MNDELKSLVLQAGAPLEVMDQLWFNLFCQQFADLLFTVVEEEYNYVAKEGDYGIAK